MGIGDQVRFKPTGRVATVVSVRQGDGWTQYTLAHPEGQPGPQGQDGAICGEDDVEPW